MMSEPIYLPSEDELVKYINKARTEHNISEGDIAEKIDAHQSTVSRMLNENRTDPGKYRPIRYSEAHDLCKITLSLISSLPDIPINQLYTHSQRVHLAGSVYSDETVGDAAGKMWNGNYTQLVARDSSTNECLGIVTDYAILKAMLMPKGVPKDWLEALKKREIKETHLIDKVPIYPLDSSLTEVAEGLMHHYAVLVEEGNGKYGIITRADYLKLFM